MKNEILRNENRREFIKRASISAAALAVLPLGFTSLSERLGTNRALAQGSCDWCGAANAPKTLSWKTVISATNEPGEPLIISGTVFRPDGKSPEKDVLLYVYHTNAKGYYQTNPSDHRHGRLRGWMRTDANGKYEFRTIKPAPYPEMSQPAHIHITVSGEGYPEYWIDSYWFEGDTLITPEIRSGLSGRGGFPSIITLKRDGDGIWRGARNIRLERIKAK